MVQSWTSRDRLYHYTTANGLKGIWNDQALRAYHYSDLNDTTECQQFVKPLEVAVKKVVVDFIKELRRNNPEVRSKLRTDRDIQAMAEQDSRSLVDIPYGLMFRRNSEDAKPNFLNPYMFSFCTHKDDYDRHNGLLSQWRGYSEAGGFALVFDAKKMNELLEKEITLYHYMLSVLESVQYEGSQRDFEDGFKKDIAVYQRAARIMIRRVVGEVSAGEAKSAIDESYISFARMATLYKHRAFREESEVRLVVSPWVPIEDIDHLLETAIDEELYKEKETMKEELLNGRRYLTLFRGSERLPIKKIIVGPCKNQQENLAFAHRVCGDTVKIVCSDTPYV